MKRPFPAGEQPTAAHPDCAGKRPEATRPDCASGRTRAFGFVGAGLGLFMMLLGAARGEVGVVFMKAVNICLECIGIG